MKPWRLGARERDSHEPGGSKGTFHMREGSPLRVTKPPSTLVSLGLFMLSQNLLGTSNLVSSWSQRKMMQSRAQRMHMSRAAWSSLQVRFQLFRWVLDQSWEVKSVTSAFRTAPSTTTTSFLELVGYHCRHGYAGAARCIPSQKLVWQD